MSNISEEKMRIEEPNYVETAELLQVDVLRKITGICKKNQVELGNEPVEISGQGARGDNHLWGPERFLLSHLF